MGKRLKAVGFLIDGGGKGESRFGQDYGEPRFGSRVIILT